MEPKRGIVIKQVNVDGGTIEPSKHVWMLDSARKGLVPIEYENHKYTIPQEAVLPCPIPAPGIGDLQEIDECFGKSREHFEVLHTSSEHWFRILRCRQHKKVFLEDARGAAFGYDRLIAVEDDYEDFDSIWTRYHYLSDDWLNYLGIAL